MLHIKTPATSANMGPGFDCIGMAFSLYNHVWAEECDDRCVIECKNDPAGNVPRTEDNLIYKSYLRFYDEMGLSNPPGLHITQEDHIPMTCGLGSSAACVVAGLLAASEISHAKITREELAFMASSIEGHPDNAAPALLGGMIVGVLTQQKLDYIKVANTFMERVRFAVMVPSFSLETSKARAVLPQTISLADGIFNASRTALLAAAFLTGDIDKLKSAMDDRFHQPERSKIIPGMADIFEKSRECGAKGVFLSGAGPTIVAVTDDEGFISAIEPFLAKLPDKWSINYLRPDIDGATVRKGDFDC